MKTKLIIVAGISSAGKSTFIDSFILPKLKAGGINTDEDVDIKFAGALLQNFELGSKPVCIVHYNLLLQFDTNPHLEQINFSNDPVFCELLKQANSSTVYLCYAPDGVLLNRINDRTKIEPTLAPSDIPYPSEIISENFNKVDQRLLLLDFGEQFKCVTENVHVIFSTNKNSTLISWDDFKNGTPSLTLQEAIT